MINALVYLSGPITAKHGRSVEQNVAAALPVYFALLQAGVPAFCPHLSAGFPSAFEVDYRLWLAYDFAVIDRCTHLLTLANWEQSAGALEEVQYARDHHVPVFHDAAVLLAALGEERLTLLAR